MPRRRGVGGWYVCRSGFLQISSQLYVSLELPSSFCRRIPQHQVVSQRPLQPLLYVTLLAMPPGAQTSPQCRACYPASFCNALSQATTCHSAQSYITWSRCPRLLHAQPWPKHWVTFDHELPFTICLSRVSNVKMVIGLKTGPCKSTCTSR